MTDDDCSFVQYTLFVAASAVRIAEVLAGLRARSLRLKEPARGGFFSLGLPAIDEALGGGLPRGRVVELYGPRGSARLSLSLSALRAGQAQGELGALVDVADAFDPRSADLDLRRLLWVRPQNVTDGLLSIDRVLDAGGFGVAVLYLGAARLHAGAGPRLQRRAEQAKCALLVVGEQAQLGSFSAAALQLRRTRARWSSHRRDEWSEPSCLPRGCAERDARGDDGLLDGAVGRVEVTRNKLGPPGDVASLELEVG